MDLQFYEKLSSTDAFIVTRLGSVPCFGIIRSGPEILQV